VQGLMVGGKVFSFTQAQCTALTVRGCLMPTYQYPYQ
jgi:hypothetical protein